MAVTEQHFGTTDGLVFRGGADYNPQSLGGSGEAEGELVFVGYSIDDGDSGYSSYAEDDNLKGKIAVMFRFEPMDDEGNSQWAESAWSRNAGFAGKVRAAATRGAADMGPDQRIGIGHGAVTAVRRRLCHQHAAVRCHAPDPGIRERARIVNEADRAESNASRSREGGGTGHGD